MIGTASVILRWMQEQPKETIFEIKEKKKSRSLTQNAYYWALVGELTKKISRFSPVTNQEIHRHNILSYSDYTFVSVKSEIDVTPFFKYFESAGTGHIGDQEFTHYKIYVGSSEMDSTQFKRLLDGCIEECRNQGIETMTPDEIAKSRYIEK